MKSLYRIAIATLLLLSIIISISGCNFIDSLKKEDGDKNEQSNNSSVTVPDTENTTPPENPGQSPDNEEDVNTTPGGSDGPSDDGEENGSDNPGSSGNGDSGSDNPGSSDNGDGGSGGNGDDSENTPGDNTGDGGENSDESEDTDFTPDMSKPNTTEITELPHLSYSNLDPTAYNKELFYKNSYKIPLGDPSVFVEYENGTPWYYLTGTNTGSSFEMWKTKNFTDWINVGTVYSPPENFFGQSSFWAPQLTYDADADWQYYLGEESESGKGLYILFFSARRSNNVCALSVAFSKSIEGPYKNFTGVNANGDYVDETNSCFEIEKLRGLNLYADHVYGNLYKAKRSFIDACPFVDPLTGDKYLYMVRSRNVDTSNDVWGVKMKDWVSPDYSTTTPLTSYGYTDINKTEPYGYLAASSNKIDEGPFPYYKDYTDDGIDNGSYYLTFSIGGTSDKLYPVCQAIGNSPLGPFTKIQPDKGGLLNCPEMHWDIHGSGHHAFFEVNGEMYVAYHTYEPRSGNTIGRRYFAFDKVEWVYNADGQYIMRSNGPSKSINPLPEASSGYTNVAGDASISVNGAEAPSTALLTDGIIATKKNDKEKLFTYSDDMVITLDFEDYVKVRAIMFYNSYDFSNAFSRINKIEFSYREESDGKIYFGTAVINSLTFSFTNNMIPRYYLIDAGENDLYQLRPSSSAIAEFNELEVNSVKIYLSNYNIDTVSAISEIVILGKPSDKIITDESVCFGGYTKEASLEPYTAFSGYMQQPDNSAEDLITIDGILNEELWTSLSTVTVINGALIDNETKLPVDVSLYGERSAKVYTYVGERKLYFAFEVTDKNLFFNPNTPQGRSTCIEIYFTTADNTTLRDGCYSIRINPTGQPGELSCNLGIYVPNDAGNEWRSITLLNVVKCAAVVNGHVGTSSLDPNYNQANNVGYTVEIAIDKILIGLGETSFRFTAAFVQDRGYNDPRIANTFITGTRYIDPSTWIVFTNKENEQ